MKHKFQLYCSKIKQFLPIFYRFFHFGAVGGMGFLVDWGSLSLLRPYVGLRIAALCAYIIAASSNWLINRYWTFRDCCRSGKYYRQWAFFLLANLPGFLVNRGIVLTLFGIWSLTHHYTVIALFIGTVGGMFINFTCCHYFVFKKN